MMPREKAGVVLIFAGIVLGACGGTILVPASDKPAPVRNPGVTYIGAWKSMPVGRALPKGLGVGLLGAGILSLVMGIRRFRD
jgi:hypothetical protein